MFWPKPKKNYQGYTVLLFQPVTDRKVMKIFHEQILDKVIWVKVNLNIKKSYSLPFPRIRRLIEDGLWRIGAGFIWDTAVLQ